MRPKTRILVVVTCAAVVLPVAGAVLWRSVRATSGPARHGQVGVRVAAVAEDGLRLRTTETLRLGAARARQVVPEGTLLTAPATALSGSPSVDARLGCEVDVTPTEGDAPTVEVRRCTATP
ncbi:hypothetical protein LX15_006089 [Streptoalloteichus tenebrarius]|uniref:Uncharacterized protein n=1 Tax=Streptoalloteichus tenebrarius (strain ATCC 17920 / DSM 40477 / JCM 4838 / CBS 697.72 / NBRC 16177 / NCIMB 11028 / NRRL B-12390 / A12253. 1 / ISP 5477) TaxID=1933 RepID=A0ABT1I3I5_STRSD|nr:hypothetical protein [Streptoalloteichus tenebrarius]MCP2262353.1 hypothetical protein [Streptoalloteichus tenebrarius]BFF02044.1 hypothetical protein GCM10020241_37190 [Streptoalloteichus tenebrarius]